MSESTEVTDYQDTDSRQCPSHQTVVIIGVTLGIGCLGSFAALCLCYWTRPKSKLTSKFSILYKRYFGFSISRAARMPGAGRKERTGQCISPGDAERRPQIFYINEKVRTSRPGIHKPPGGHTDHTTRHWSNADVEKLTNNSGRAGPVLSVGSLDSTADGYVSLGDYTDLQDCVGHSEMDEAAADVYVNQTVLKDRGTVSPDDDVGYSELRDYSTGDVNFNCDSQGDGLGQSPV